MSSNRDQGKAPADVDKALLRHADQRFQPEDAACAGGTAKLLHDLQVHQIELSLQNEELRASQQAAEAACKRYNDLYDFAPVGFFTLGADGVIIELNMMAAKLLGNKGLDLTGWKMANFIDHEDLRCWASHFADVLSTDDKRSCDLRIRRLDGHRFEARLESVRSNIPEPRSAHPVILIALSDISEQRRAERERAAHASRLAELSKRLAQAQEEERKRLSGEIHDRTSPNLAALNLNLHSLMACLPQPLVPRVEDLLADIGALVDDTAASLRQISTDLRPPVLDYAGLVPAIESAAGQLARRTGVTVKVDSAGLRQRPAPELETPLFRIANEALTNCAKHAGARTVNIVLANEADKVVMRIADDGTGFDANALPGGGQGLISMRERTEFAGGTFRIESAPGQGTRIEVRV